MMVQRSLLSFIEKDDDLIIVDSVRTPLATSLRLFL